MMRRIFFLSCVGLLLLGCQDHHTYDYLMTHPQVLEKKAAQCQGSTDEQCRVVQQAANDFYQLMTAQQSDPEKFGNQILQDETACQAAKTAGNEKLYADLQQKIRYELAVVSMTSPG